MPNRSNRSIGFWRTISRSSFCYRQINMLQRYRKKADTPVRAIRLDLDMPGFHYRKWGGEQFAKPGDWLVDNGGDVYTIDADSFASTYEKVAPGVYRKTAVVYAEQAAQDGRIETCEGTTHYRAGDYLVYNDAARQDGYAVAKEIFERLYEPVS